MKKYVLLIFLVTLSLGSATSNLKVVKPIQTKSVEELLKIQKRVTVPFAVPIRQKDPFTAYAVHSDSTDFIYIESDKKVPLSDELTIVGDRAAVKAKYRGVFPHENKDSCGEKVTRYLARYEINENPKMTTTLGLDPAMDVEVVPLKLDFKKAPLPSELREYTKEHIQHSGYYGDNDPFDKIVNNCEYRVSQKFEEIRCGFIAFFLDDRKLIGTTGTDSGTQAMTLLSVFKIDGKKYYHFNIESKVRSSRRVYSEDGESVGVKNGNYEILCD